MTKTAIISAADANYFPMMREWIASIRSFPQSKDIDICILDSGLTPSQTETLKSLGCPVKPAQWPCTVPDWKIRGRDYLKGIVCKPFLPEYFPGYETYLWMDPDTWVQRWEGVDMFLTAAQTGSLAVTGQVDRAYPRAVRIKWLGPLPVKLRGFYFTNAKKAFGLKTAKKLYPYHVLLAGMFALRGDAPHWKRWQELIIQAMQKGKIFTAEQLTLGVLCYLEDFPKEILPAWTHWLCEFKPLWNEEEGVFVEPYLPRKEIGVLHLSGWDEMRINRSVTTNFQTTKGGTVEKSYRYPAFDGEKSNLLPR